MFPSTAKTDEHSPVGQKYDGKIFHVTSLGSTKQPKADMFYFTAKHPINQHSFVMSAGVATANHLPLSICILFSHTTYYLMCFFLTSSINLMFRYVSCLVDPTNIFTSPPPHTHTVSILTITVQSPWLYLLKHLTCAVHMMYYTPR